MRSLQALDDLESVFSRNFVKMKCVGGSFGLISMKYFKNIKLFSRMPHKLPFTNFEDFSFFYANQIEPK